MCLVFENDRIPNSIYYSDVTMLLCFSCYSWNITGHEGQGITEKLVVMYSIPYSHDLHTNWIAIGLFDQHDPKDTRQKDTKPMFQKMYSGEQDKFARKDFYNDIKPVLFHGEKFYVEATCGTDHKPTIKVCISCEIEIQLH